MSMLAEPKARKRYTLTPRGKALYEDDARFGTKMLKKMGWSKEKGLGASEEGSKDFVRLRYKNNAQGFGYEERDDQWTEHEKTFTGLLKTLNGEDNKADSDNDVSKTGFGFAGVSTKLKEKYSGESLEEKSKQSKARVHYKKFTRGKDLSRYSETDLANIFGRKGGVVVTDEHSMPYNPEYNKEKEENKSGILITESSLSVNDYFKQKMAQRQKQQENEVNHVETVADEDISNRKNNKQIACESTDVANEAEDVAINADKKARKRKNKELLNEHFSMEAVGTDIATKKKSKKIETILVEDVEEDDQLSRKEKKMLKKKNKQLMINAAIDDKQIMDNDVTKKEKFKHAALETSNENSTCVEENKQSKKKNKHMNYTTELTQDLNDGTSIMENDVQKKKHKSKKTLLEISGEQSEKEIATEDDKPQKKKEKKHTSDTCIDIPVNNENKKQKTKKMKPTVGEIIEHAAADEVQDSESMVKFGKELASSKINNVNDNKENGTKFIKSNLSVNDYFEQKMRQKNLYQFGQTKMPKGKKIIFNENQIDSDEHLSTAVDKPKQLDGLDKELKTHEKEDIATTEVPEEIVSKEQTLKDRKERKKKSKLNHTNGELIETLQQSGDMMDNTDEPKVKKNRKSKEKILATQEVEASVADVIEKRKKQKDKSKQGNLNELSIETTEIIDSAKVLHLSDDDNQTQLKQKKKHKKKNKEKTFTEETVENANELSIDNKHEQNIEPDELEDTTKGSKKKLKTKDVEERTSEMAETANEVVGMHIDGKYEDLKPSCEVNSKGNFSAEAEANENSLSNSELPNINFERDEEFIKNAAATSPAAAIYLAKLKKLNQFTISTFSAEKFAHTDISMFAGSNLSEIVGYCWDEDTVLNVKESATDQQNILDLWGEKYRKVDPKLNFHNYCQKINKCDSKKRPQYQSKSFKRKSAFQSI